MGSPVVVVPPVRPTALLAHVLAHCAHPTTLIVCSSSTDFVRRCVDDACQEDDGDGGGDGVLHTASLLQVAVARHIRVAFVPTVAHLRGFLAALDLAASRVTAPPAADTLVSSGGAPPPARRGDHALVVYDFLRLHRDTSEWSSQGLSASAAVLVEAGWRTGLDVLVVDGGRPQMEGTETTGSTDVWDEKMPVLSTGPRRQLQKAGYPLRTERVKAVLARWFAFRESVKEEEVEVHSEETEEKVEKVRKAEKFETAATDDALTGPVEVERMKATDEANEDPVTFVEEAVQADAEGTGDGSLVEETIQVVEEKPQKTFVRDSEDEDDLSDEAMDT
ncbi:hypothetical protein HMPREF1624_00825 [Sporothrix schenckii ATCC 58251]|uniref:Uncharacterized protein n=1 Tax=Sporothrix schenckii (strain ATCC 58251 / de Perez 2211183) TaxID=1391915 RepID=U7Q730_SPOS1|nr:hypothetical protein HMPREF1624_00825 [Sporothrix schenckii ATCC 58251]